MTTLETLLLRLETGPWDVLYRALIGFGTIAAFARFRSESWSEWSLLVWLLCVLAALRVGAAVARKVLPFSESAQRTWAERRGLTKRYDSYQWQKLRGFGIGLALYMVAVKQFTRPQAVIAAACLVFGVIASLRWSHLRRNVA